MNKTCCNAPCIINATMSFHLVFCGKDAGHADGHSFETKDRLNGSKIVIGWRYLGCAEAGENISYAPSLNERCEKWAHLTHTVELLRGPLKLFPEQSLLRLSSNEVGYCCEKKPGHDGQHIRSGIFGPLGISWNISW